MISRFDHLRLTTGCLYYQASPALLQSAGLQAVQIDIQTALSLLSRPSMDLPESSLYIMMLHFLSDLYTLKADPSIYVTTPVLSSCTFAYH